MGYKRCPFGEADHGCAHLTSAQMVAGAADLPSFFFAKKEKRYASDGKPWKISVSDGGCVTVDSFM